MKKEPQKGDYNKRKPQKVRDDKIFDKRNIVIQCRMDHMEVRIRCYVPLKIVKPRAYKSEHIKIPRHVYTVESKLCTYFLKTFGFTPLKTSDNSKPDYSRLKVVSDGLAARTEGFIS